MFNKNLPSLPNNYHEVLPEDFKEVKYRFVDNSYWFGANRGYSYKIEQKGNKLILTRSGLSITGNMGIGLVAQGLTKEKKDREVFEVELVGS